MRTLRTLRPVLTLERILLALERELLEASDEEIIAAARELGMNPAMKGSAAFMGLKYGYAAQLLGADGLRPLPGATGPAESSAARRGGSKDEPAGNG